MRRGRLAPSSVVSVALATPNDPLPDCMHPVVFEYLDKYVIYSIVLRVNGAAGPSGLDAHSWQCLCTYFHNASTDLYRSLSLVARKYNCNFC